MTSLSDASMARLTRSARAATVTPPVDDAARSVLLSYGPAAVVRWLGPAAALELAGPAPAPPPPGAPGALAPQPRFTLPDAVTLAGYGLGVYWSLGGPTWAGVVSVIADEVDGRLARATGATTTHGGELDWGADVALTPLALARLGREVGHPALALAAAPPVLYVQAMLRDASWRPTVGSARAAITLAAIAAREILRRPGR